MLTLKDYTKQIYPKIIRLKRNKATQVVLGKTFLDVAKRIKWKKVSFKARALNKKLKKYNEKLNCKVFRHAYQSLIFGSIRAKEKVRKIIGHTQTKTTEIYIHEDFDKKPLLALADEISDLPFLVKFLRNKNFIKKTSNRF
jgi:site-specific recombinase XerC